ncbi:MAG TPA: hypothetical protein ENL03_00225 [Phycisphaerae bacterium]|nr:hypothetical protein [Phycisphaerae bacterium]
MFYWSYRGIHIVLTNEEETDLVRRLAEGNAIDVVGYNVSPATRKTYERKMFAYLKNYLITRPDDFNKEYTFRSWWNEEARTLFPLFLDAYGRITKNATIGGYGGDPLLDDMMENVLHSENDDVYHVTLLRRRYFPWPTYVASGRLSFPSSIIEHVAGTVDNFVLMTSIFNIRFGHNFVRVSIPGKREEKHNNGMNADQ